MFNEHALVGQSLALYHRSFPNPFPSHRNTQIIDTCVVFKQWHIHNYTQFILSLIAITALGVGYEWLRLYSKTLDVRIAYSLAKGKNKSATVLTRRSPSPDQENAGLLTGQRATKALYGLFRECFGRVCSSCVRLQDDRAHFSTHPSSKCLRVNCLSVLFPNVIE